jgi:hypothetical protein
MADRKVQTMNVIIRCDVAANQASLTVAGFSADSNILDTPGAGEPVVFPGNDPAMTWDGSKTGDVILGECLTRMIRKYNQ